MTDPTGIVPWWDLEDCMEVDLQSKIPWRLYLHGWSENVHSLLTCDEAHRVPSDFQKLFSMTFPWQFIYFLWPSLFPNLHLRCFAENLRKCGLARSLLNFLVVTTKYIQIWYNLGAKLVKFYDWSQNSMAFVMFHDFSMTIFIFQGFPVSVGTLSSDILVIYLRRCSDF